MHIHFVPGNVCTPKSHDAKLKFTLFLNRQVICDVIKGNESLVEIVNFYFLTPLSHNIKMLHFYVNPITIGYLVTEL